MKIINPIFCSIILFICGCGPETGREKATYAIQNVSETTVKIEFVNLTVQFENNVIFLNEGERFVGEELERGNGASLSSSESIAPGQSLAARGVIFIFDNARQVEYDFDASGEDIIFSEPLNRNPLRVGSYEMIDEENYLYTITQEDYNNATPCDGPCE